MALLQALFGVFCRADNPPECCGCKEEPEVLTRAWIDRLEQVSVLAELAAKGSGATAAKDGGSQTAGKASPGAGAGAPGATDGGSSEVAAAQQQQQQQHQQQQQQQQRGRCNGGRSPTMGAVAALALAGGNGLGMLAVPPEFDGVRGGVLQAPSSAVPDPGDLDGAGPPECTGGTPLCAADKQRRCLQASLRAFTRALLRGISVSVLLDDGCTCLAEARLDSELTHLVLHVPNAQHPVALRSIESVCAPEEAWLPQVCASRLGQMDVCCATLIIEGGQFLTFVFDTPRTREYFEVCLKVLILARESSSPAAAHNPVEALPGKLAAVGPRMGGADPDCGPDGPRTDTGASVTDRALDTSPQQEAGLEANPAEARSRV